MSPRASFSTVILHKDRIIPHRMEPNCFRRLYIMAYILVWRRVVCLDDIAKLL